MGKSFAISYRKVWARRVGADGADGAPFRGAALSLSLLHIFSAAFSALQLAFGVQLHRQCGRGRVQDVYKSKEQKVSQQQVEQIIRPTGLLDPEIIVRGSASQIDDIIDEAKAVSYTHLFPRGRAGQAPERGQPPGKFCKSNLDA